MSNIGKTQTIIYNNQPRTPTLPKENLYIICDSSKSDGAIRAFYLSLIQKKETTKILMELID